MENQICAFCGKESANTILAYYFKAEYGWNTGTRMGKMDRSKNLDIPLCNTCLTQRKKREKRNFIIWGISFVVGIALCILLGPRNDVPSWAVTLFILILVFLVFGIPLILFRTKSEEKKILHWLEKNDNETWRHITFQDIKGN
ncbi:MAG: hypothetical protein QY332_18015 [Anaerolineales bacterium]|nr:MAG: hypothetical protein QY332_18015 [Anaerolineales bacterium]